MPKTHFDLALCDKVKFLLLLFLFCLYINKRTQTALRDTVKDCHLSVSTIHCYIYHKQINALRLLCVTKSRLSTLASQPFTVTYTTNK